MAASKFTPGKFDVVLTALGLLGFLATQVVTIVRARKLNQILQRVFLSLLAGGALVLLTDRTCG